MHIEKLLVDIIGPYSPNSYLIAKAGNPKVDGITFEGFWKYITSMYKRPNNYFEEKFPILTKNINYVLSTLTEREYKVIKLIYQGNTGSEVGKITPNLIRPGTGIGRQQVSQIKMKCLRKLRHPSRSQKFMNFESIYRKNEEERLEKAKKRHKEKWGI
jgi:hypothetical protein